MMKTSIIKSFASRSNSTVSSLSQVLVAASRRWRPAKPSGALSVSHSLRPHAHMEYSCVPEFHCVVKSSGATAQTIQPHPLLVGEICLGWLKGLEHNVS